MIRLLSVVLTLLVITPWYGVQVLFRRVTRSANLPLVCRRCQLGWCRGVLRAAGVNVQLRGLDSLDLRGGQIIVANHASWFDVPALAGYLPVETCFIAKKELGRVPIFGPSFQACGHIPIDRSNREAAIEGLNKAGERIRAERKSVILFPEGTRTGTGELQPFKLGAFVLAIQAGVPVVPVAIHGSREVLPKGSLLIRSGTIHVDIGAPIDARDFDLEQREDLRLEARHQVEAMLGAGIDTSARPD